MNGQQHKRRNWLLSVTKKRMNQPTKRFLTSIGSRLPIRCQTYIIVNYLPYKIYSYVFEYDLFTLQLFAIIPNILCFFFNFDHLGRYMHFMNDTN